MNGEIIKLAQGVAVLHVVSVMLDHACQELTPDLIKQIRAEAETKLGIGDLSK